MEKFSYTKLLKYSKILKDSNVKKILQQTLDEYDIVGIREIEKVGNLINVSI